MSAVDRSKRLSENKKSVFASFNIILEREEQKGDEYNPYLMPHEQTGDRFEQDGRWEFRAHSMLPPPPPFTNCNKAYVSDKMASFIDWQAKERSAVFDI